MDMLAGWAEFAHNDVEHNVPGGATLEEAEAIAELYSLSADVDDMHADQFFFSKVCPLLVHGP